MQEQYSSDIPRYDVRITPANAAAAKAVTDPKTVIYKLQNLKQEFNDKAADYQRMADTVDAALSLLQDTENKKQEALREKEQLASQQRAALIGGMFMGLGKKGEKEAFVFMIDGSGSMIGKPLEAALGAVAEVSQGAKMAKTPPETPAGFWGDREPRWLGNEDLSDPALRVKLVNGLNSGTDLAPAAKKMLETATANNAFRSHFVVLSDGDLGDEPAAREALKNMLQTAPSATLDILVMNWAYNKGHETPMEKMAQSLQQGFPGRVKLRAVPLDDTVHTAVGSSLVEIVADRLAPARAKKRPAPKP